MISLLSRKSTFAFIGTLVIVGFAGATAPRADAGTFVYYDFNTATSTATLFTPTSGTSTMSSNFVAANITSFTGTTINAVSPSVAGTALALQGGTSNVNNGSYLQFTANTTGLNSIMVSYATQKTSTGFISDQFQYSTDGVTFTNFGTAYNPALSFALQSFDLSSITGINNDANTAFRIIFNGATGASGNNRIDNLQIAGTSAVTATPELSTNAALFTGALGLGVLMIAKRRKLQASV